VSTGSALTLSTDFLLFILPSQDSQVAGHLTQTSYSSPLSYLHKNLRYIASAQTAQKTPFSTVLLLFLLVAIVENA
jgi:hypothetical protein